ncbi:proto-oncogene vav [Puma concolor]|uniref:Proto-oncogene vav n=1 Tax=Puma concolor TaxID=9696 RepID=A0A6P6H905_PUMCO|nr:proto-oncogene vav [Puma concolor]
MQVTRLEEHFQMYLRPLTHLGRDPRSWREAGAGTKPKALRLRAPPSPPQRAQPSPAAPGGNRAHSPGPAPEDPASNGWSQVSLTPRDVFLCLKNIRTFLSTCCEKFGLKRSELFEAFDLFDVQDFGKVIYTLSALSWTPIAQNKGIMPFPTEEETVGDEDIYSGLSDQIDVVCSGSVHVCQCRSSSWLSDILHFMKPLQRFLKPQDIEIIFINIEDLLRVHTLFLKEMKEVLGTPGAPTLYQVFIKYKERFLVYGRYCSQVESASKHLDHVAAAREDVQMKLEECSQRANNGRFTLRDLLMVPMQRVLKYHLLLQELVKHTQDVMEKENLRQALDAMRDLAQCVNEVKRDNETLRQITNFQLSIENLDQSLAHYGRPKIDGELKITSVERRSKMDRYAFLLDKALLICKRRGDSYDLKNVVDLQSFQVRDDSSGERENKKWTHMFLLIEDQGSQGYELFFKTRELKKKWLEQFEMAISNIYPENATANGHDFQMFSFEETTSCKACQMLLRGTFYQGYRCHRCRAPAHKECLGRVPPCGRHGQDFSGTMKKDKPHRRPQDKKRNDLGLPKMEVCQEYYGLPPPPGAIGPFLRLNPGDIVELTKAEAEQNWWEGRNTATNEVGWFPCNRVKPYVHGPPQDLTVHLWYNVEVKHIKIMTAEGLYRITEKKAFRGLTELVEFYQQNSLKDCFKSLDTCLQFPFKEPERRAISKPPAGSTKYFGTAKARYDFCARDRSELSLKEGDIIKILNKKGQQGWWRGEIYGRVGWFPSNYVEEDYSEYC